MDERAVRAAVDDLVSKTLDGTYIRNGVECKLVPSSAIDALVDAVADVPDPPTDRPFVK